MSTTPSRRSVISLTAALATGVALGTAGTTEAATAESGTAAVARRSAGLPEVPGMLGDRWANEFWYQFDQETNFAPSRQLLNAYAAISSYVGGDLKSGMRAQWLTLSGRPEYPRNFISYVTPLARPLAVVSAAQLNVIDRFYPHYGRGIIDAFAYFGEGVLYDPRRVAMQEEVHTMNDLADYQTWHAYQRAMTFLDISRSRWEQLAPVTGFAWAVQAVAKPQQRKASPPLPPQVLRRLEAAWLHCSQQQLDDRFRRSTPQ
jgi:hypothetical protein